MTDKQASDYLDQPTRITRDGIHFGDEKLAGLIAEDGILLKPGGHDGVNKLTVTFLVGPVVCDDPLVAARPAGTETEPATQYSNTGVGGSDR